MVAQIPDFLPEELNLDVIEELWRDIGSPPPEAAEINGLNLMRDVSHRDSVKLTMVLYTLVRQAAAELGEG